jgi:hypothetical protein
MLTATTPGSSWPSCHIAPGWLGTWKAKPRCAPLPTLGRDAFSLHAHPASPHQSGGCALAIQRQEPPDAQWDYHRPCPDTGLAATQQRALAVPPRWPRWSPPKVWGHGCWLPPRSRSRGLRWPPPVGFACSQLYLDLWGCGQSGPPHTGFTHRSVRRLPCPVHAPNSSHRVWMMAQILGKRPPAAHLWQVRWMVLSSPNSWGNWFHWQPLRIRWMMPLSICLGSVPLRPVCLGGSSSRMIGSISSYKSSGTSQMVSNSLTFSITPTPPWNVGNVEKA